MRSWLSAAIALGGCGRLSFDPLVDAPGAGDAPSCIHTFCDDFNRAGPVQGGWDRSSSTNGATADLLGQQFHVHLPAPSEGFYLEKDFPAATTGVDIGFSIAYGDGSTGNPEIDLVQLQWKQLPIGTCTAFGFYLVRDGSTVEGRFDLQETYFGCGSNVNTRLSNLDDSGVHTVLMRLTFSGGTRISVELDGTTVIDNIAAAHDASPSLMTLRVGGGRGDVVTPAPWDIRYDDLYVDVH